MEMEPRCEWCGAWDQALREKLILAGKRTLSLPDMALRAPVICDECRELLKGMMASYRIALERATAATTPEAEADGEATPAPAGSNPAIPAPADPPRPHLVQ
jgi:hypothetical protein